MNKSQSINDTASDDLQKAIDDITNTTNVDPVFSDPVAAPSSVPEGDTGELGQPVGPFPEPAMPAPTPTFPTEPTSNSNFNHPTLTPPPKPPMPDNLSAFEPAPGPIPEPAPEPMSTETTSVATPNSQNLSTNQIKKAALRDLLPILNKVSSLDANQKFKIYQDVFSDLKDYTVLEPAYNIAREIPDETERAEALLYLIESIDKM